MSPMSQIEQRLRMSMLEANEKDFRSLVVDGFARMDTKFTQIDENFQWVRGEFARMDKKFTEIDQKLDAHEEQIDVLAVTLNETKISLENRVDRLEKKMDSQFDAVHQKIDLILNALALT